MAGASKLEPYWAWFWSLQPCSCIIAEWSDPHVVGAWAMTLQGSLTGLTLDSGIWFVLSYLDIAM
jgi:hypothetical protein